ncbi:MAG TPA: UvrB/UvrC motif-containing protein, partial [Ignavibacteriaceae bacterium]|nr:UvrB/UvrC motif-containing protein [Ignavibacteriaceae bacterium]
KEYNEKSGIVPATIYKSMEDIMSSTSIADIRKKDDKPSYGFSKVAEPILKYMDKEQKEDLVAQLTEEMHKAAKDLEFEKAANLRDEISKLKKMIG